MGRSLLWRRGQSRVAILRPCTHPVWGRTTARGSGQSVHPEGPQCPRFCPPPLCVGGQVGRPLDFPELGWMQRPSEVFRDISRPGPSGLGQGSPCPRGLTRAQAAAGGRVSQVTEARSLWPHWPPQQEPQPPLEWRRRGLGSRRWASGWACTLGCGCGSRRARGRLLSSGRPALVPGAEDRPSRDGVEPALRPGPGAARRPGAPRSVSPGWQRAPGGPVPQPDAPAVPAAPCRPCGDTEVLLAVCTSDFGECSRSRHGGVRSPRAPAQAGRGSGSCSR